MARKFSPTRFIFDIYMGHSTFKTSDTFHDIFHGGIPELSEYYIGGIFCNPRKKGEDQHTLGLSSSNFLLWMICSTIAFSGVATKAAKVDLIISFLQLNLVLDNASCFLILNSFRHILESPVCLGNNFFGVSSCFLTK